ncbi:hypothetical protein BKA65DRAFT_552824 [Rhexocercosporidium sp. MPI-PUGE-AT-0058]|nr:hypothetical protein BKA65DRAFT_552824 [Rhexocercosporidium sp. MPI-PUGE-AT-0058]
MAPPRQRPAVQTTTMQSNSQHRHLVTNIHLGGPSSSPRTVKPPVVPVVFTLFPLLPLELRRKIWRDAITPRTIYVLRNGKGVPWSWKLITSSTISLLSSNRESRSEGLQMYEQLFSTCHISGQGSECHGPCYVSFAYDLIYINQTILHHNFESIFVDEMLSGDPFMNIALDRRSLHFMESEMKDIADSRDNGLSSWPWKDCKLKYVKELVLVVDHLRHRDNRHNPPKVVIGDKTHRSTPIKKQFEIIFTNFKSKVPEAILPELSTCYRILDLR